MSTPETMWDDAEMRRRAGAYDELVEALTLTTRALLRAKTPGAEIRVKESDELLKKLGHETVGLA